MGSKAITDLHPAWWLLGLLLLVYPWLASDFFISQIGAYSLVLGMIALSLMMLAGYGGMVSLAQVTAAGLAAYCVPIFHENSVNVLGLGWPLWIVYPVAVLVAALFSAFVGLIAVRTAGIYMIMITLAVAVSVFYFTNQNYDLFNGFTGYLGVKSPEFWGVNWRDPMPFYYVCLGASAFFLISVGYGSRSAYGLALQAVRDNPRRMATLGYNVVLIRVFAFFLAGIIAGVAGLLLVSFNGRIAPSTIGVDFAIDILVIAVVGGLRHPIGPFIGALAFVLLENFAIDLIDRERFNTVIGLSFLLIVLFSSDGLLGLWQKFSSRFLTKAKPAKPAPA